jgi:fermentation-respiration switch protein FrsA (DUF1100 family)
VAPIVRHAVRIVVAAAIAAGAAIGCAPSLDDVQVGGVRLHIIDTSVRLHDHDLLLHLSMGRGAKTPVILYATGDAGWWGHDTELFLQLAAWGLPSVGFSSREYVTHLEGNAETETPGVLADDIQAMIAVAEHELSLAAHTPVVFVGKSRGAGLAVAAATVAPLRARLAGVLAVGLTQEEEYIRLTVPALPAGGPSLMLHTYSALSQIQDVPVAVIQSTRDEYISAADARVLFGPDSPTRRFRPIVSDAHNFGGAVDTMYTEMRRSADWILKR